MKIKSLITLALLFVLGFSTVHEYVFAFYDSDTCTTTEYVQELDIPSDHGDICDIHFEYHQAYMFSSNNIFLQKINKTSELILEKKSYDFQTNLSFVKPPIA